MGGIQAPFKQAPHSANFPLQFGYPFFTESVYPGRQSIQPRLNLGEFGVEPLPVNVPFISH
jgi:hypothetical protein